MKKQDDLGPRGSCLCCGATVHYRDAVCPSCGRPNRDWVQSWPGLCGNCHAELEKEDRFCRICGTPVGDGAFEPFQNVAYCVYGPPPIQREHVCPDCGYRWTTYRMIDEDRYCPRCGSRAACIEHDPHRRDFPTGTSKGWVIDDVL